MSQKEKGIAIYLGFPILLLEEGTKFGREIEKEFPSVTVLYPLDVKQPDPVLSGIIKEERKIYDTSPEEGLLILLQNISPMKKSQLAIFYWPTRVFSVGISMDALICSLLDKPIIIYSRDEFILFHPYLQGLSSFHPVYFSKEKEEVFAVLQRILSDKEP